VSEWASDAEPSDPEVHRVRAEIYQRRRDAELSLMAKGIFAAAANDSSARASAPDDSDDPPDGPVRPRSV